MLTNFLFFFNRKDMDGALAASLENPPVLAKTPDVKKQAAAVVAQVMCAQGLKDNEIDAMVAKLNETQADLLMKYIYRCLEHNEVVANGVPLFKWHKAVKDKAGIGCIVRALVERKTV